MSSGRAYPGGCVPCKYVKTPPRLKWTISNTKLLLRLESNNVGALSRSLSLSLSLSLQINDMHTPYCMYVDDNYIA